LRTGNQRGKEIERLPPSAWETSPPSALPYNLQRGKDIERGKEIGKKLSAGRKSRAVIRGLGEKGRDRERKSTVPAGFRFLCTLSHPARLHQFQHGTRDWGFFSMLSGIPCGFVNSSMGQEGLGETRRSPVLHSAQFVLACCMSLLSLFLSSLFS
jgi:hypothetical protein